MSLTLSAKASRISVPSVWNSLSFNCRSCKLFSTFARTSKTELFETAYSPCHLRPLICLWHMALYKFVLIDWLIELYDTSQTWHGVAITCGIINLANALQNTRHFKHWYNITGKHRYYFKSQAFEQMSYAIISVHLLPTSCFDPDSNL